MAAKSEVLEAMRKVAGKQLQVVTTAISREMIEEFVDVTGDTNPLWRDEEFAKKAGYDGVIAPPSLLWTSKITYGKVTGEISYNNKRFNAIIDVFPPEFPKDALDAGGEWEVFEAVRPGDVITATAKLGEPYEREGKRGTMVFCSMTTEYRNQKDELVGRYTHNFVWSPPQ
jgi:hypothetical protein